MEYKDIYIYTESLYNLANVIRDRGKLTETFSPQNMDDAVYEHIFFEGITFEGYGGVLEECTNVVSGFTNLANYYRNDSRFIYKAIVSSKSDGNLYRAFENCQNLLYPAICTRSIWWANYAFNNCTNLIGPPTFGVDRKAKIVSGHYDNGDPIFQYGPLLTDAMYMYANCVNMKGNPVFGSYRTMNLQCTYYNCRNLDGTNLSLTAYGYNKEYKKNFYGTLWNCVNLKARLNRSNSDMYDPNMNVIYATAMFANCSNLLGEPIAFNGSYTSMSGMYQGCSNLIGNGCCGPHVTSMHHAFYGCSNLNGYGESGPYVTDMYWAYRDCYKLASGNVGPNVNNIVGVFANCNNLKGYINLGTNVDSGNEAFRNCVNLGGVILPDRADKVAYKAANFNNMFGLAYGYSERSVRLNVIFDTRATLAIFRNTNIAGCVMTSIEDIRSSPEWVTVPIADWNGKIIGTKNIGNCGYKCYNEQYNIYMYAQQVL